MKKIQLIGTLAFIVAFFLFISGSIKLINLYNNIFRLSLSEVNESLYSKIPKCGKIAECDLQGGDILIRRYITERTQVADRLANPYFTHSAFYLGGNQIVEAVGTEENSQDDIQTAIFSTSDWFNEDEKSFIIIRPRKYSSHLESIRNNLRRIAEDPEYAFGLPETGSKKAMCADLILNQLISEGVVKTQSSNKIITPDFLFYLLISNPEDFEVVGFSII